MLGKGFFLDGVGSISSDQNEVISGRNSIRGSYSGPDSYTGVLSSDPTFIQFDANETYTITLTYRILAAGSRGFSFGFFSDKGYPESLVSTALITGSTGSSGTASHRVTLRNFSDYQFQFKIDGTGAIAIDEVRIADSGGRVVASENAEGPTLGRGPLNFVITDAVSRPLELKSKPAFSGARDLNGDGYPETILTFAAAPPSTAPIPILVVESRARLNLASRDFFPSGIPSLKNAWSTVFADLDGDGLQDMVFAEAGSDGDGSLTGGATPGSRIVVGLNVGVGRYRDASALVPPDFDSNKSPTLAVGDLDADGRVEIILPDTVRGSNTALLRWNGAAFAAQRNWIDQRLWSSPTDLRRQSGLRVHDMDNDGIQDLVVGGDTKSPNLRILFGAGAGSFTTAGLVTLPDGPFGHAPNDAQRVPIQEGAESFPLVADFNNDGLLDVFVNQELVKMYLPGALTDTNEPQYSRSLTQGGYVGTNAGFQVFINQGSRRFAEVTSASPVTNLGRRFYQAVMALDMNNDGFKDVVGLYQTQHYAGVKEQWSTTLFLNDGTGAFQVVDGDKFMPVTTTTPNGRTWGLGAFVPTVVEPGRTEGIVYEPSGWGGGAGFNYPTLNLYRVYANRALGTGPDFEDSTALGVPGFNEFYYLRRYPDAADAVRSGQFRTGLAHYLAVGRDRGYAPNARSQQPQ